MHSWSEPFPHTLVFQSARGVDYTTTDISVSPDFYTENGKYIQGVSLPVGVEGTWDGNHVYHFGSQRKVGNIELEIYGDDALFIDQAGFDHYDGNNYTPQQL